MLPLMRDRARPIWTSVLLLALYIAAGGYSTQMMGGPGEVVLFWPAAGIGLAAVVRYGLRWAPLVPLGVLGVHLLFDPVPMLFLAYSMAANLLGVLAGAALILRGPAPEPMSVRFGLRGVAGGGVMSAVSALVGTTGMVHAGMLPPGDWPWAAGRWLLADLLGVTSIAPAVLLASLPASRRGRLPSGDYAPEGERLAWNVALAASFLLMGWGASLGGYYALGLVALPLAVLVWSAIRFTPLHTAMGIAVTMLLVSAVAGFGLAGFPPPQAPVDGLNLLGFLIVVSVLPMTLSVAMYQQRSASHRLQQRADTDALTGLASRDAFERRVKAALADVSAPPMALAYLDLDHLKLINDTASHAAGDELIRGVAGLLEAHRHPDDLLARTGGDEFALLLRNCAPMVAEDRVRVLLRAIEGYRQGWGRQMLATTASAGVVAFLPGQAEYAQLLSQADAACFTAKEQGGNRVCMARPDAGDLLDRTAAMRWVVRLRESLEHKALALHCQSIVPLQPGLESGRHFEVLLRIRDPHSGEELMPGRFMPAAERFHLGTRIDREVLAMTLDWLDAHPGQAESVSTCCINLSGDALADEGFLAFVAERLRRSRFPGGKLCFEVTETSAVRDLARAQRFIGQLRSLGCRFALDDFGAGFCSFNYLRSLDVDYFKIDGSFVRDMDSSPMAEAVVRSINEIAHVLDKRSIAEHTESERQRRALAAMGVDYAQGHALDRPAPIADYFARPFPEPAR
ncbi:putative bifunctional diguanylate cyclase/phosphodiesterase [Arenimonas fontis]|uniref:EAL domain-containing protein n=1 Tax=Arenimonas fontis TaxID=2608255 RepID=A0A5B2ZAQ9_9GAMM|nr:EAL domain-containing protein [Arenimonas fontis]KAA2285186.1 EAL domain-containing protein [Arenimonas fontis]